MVRVAFFARQPHWIDHLAPVYKALKPAERGPFYVWPHLMEHAKLRGIKAEVQPSFPQWGPYTVVAGEADRGRINHGRVIRFEHGAGFSFGAGMSQRADRHPSYAGGKDQQNVAMFLNPNHWANDRWRLFYPQVPSEIVGSPKMDRLSLIPKPDNPIPVVALTWHWDAIGIGFEARSAFKYYREQIASFLERTDIRIIGHCHPKGRTMMQPWFETKGIEFIEDLEDAFALADVWVNDASSTLYEAAALGKPVVVLNAPWYRREIHHGLRFWEGSDIGPNVWVPEQLNRAVNLAIQDPSEIRERREEVAAEVFPYIGTASKRAAECIRGLVEGSWTNSRISVSA